MGSFTCDNATTRSASWSSRAARTSDSVTTTGGHQLAFHRPGPQIVWIAEEPSVAGPIRAGVDEIGDHLSRFGWFGRAVDHREHATCGFVLIGSGPPSGGTRAGGVARGQWDRHDAGVPGEFRLVGESITVSETAGRFDEQTIGDCVSASRPLGGRQTAHGWDTHVESTWRGARCPCGPEPWVPI